MRENVAQAAIAAAQSHHARKLQIPSAQKTPPSYMGGVLSNAYAIFYL